MTRLTPTLAAPRSRMRPLPLLLVLALVAVHAQTPVDYDMVKNFKLPEYDEKTGDLKSVLHGAEAKVYRKTGISDMKEMRIEVYHNDKVETVVSSPGCQYLMDKGQATSEEKIQITRSDMEVTGIGYKWERDAQRFEIRMKARVVLKNAKLDMLTPEKKTDATPANP
jgi:hypothetical protein